jgi:hypothetical protein
MAVMYNTVQKTRRKDFETFLYKEMINVRDDTFSLIQTLHKGLAKGCITVIPVTWEAEVGESE